MKAVIFTILTIFLIAVNSKVIPGSSSVENQPTSNEPFQLSDLITQAQNSISALTKQMQEQMNIPNQDTFITNLKEQSTNFVNSVQAYVKNVTEQVKEKNPELERLWGDIKGKLNKAVEDINEQIPNAQEQVNQLQAKLTEGVQTLVTESDKTIKALNHNSEKVQEEVTKLTKKAVDIALQATQNLNQQLQQKATEAQS